MSTTVVGRTLEEEYTTGNVPLKIPTAEGSNKRSQFQNNTFVFKYNTKNNNIQVFEKSFPIGRTTRVIGTLDVKNNTFTDGSQVTISQSAYFNSKEGKLAIKKGVADELNDKGLLNKEINDLLGTNFQLENPKTTTLNGAISNQIEKSKRLQRESYENLVYPTTLRRSNNDRLKITVLTPISAGGDEFGEDIKEPIGSVTLPVPGNFSDKNQVDFKSGTLNPLEKALAESGLEALLDGRTEKLEGNLKRALDGKDELKSVVAGLFVGKAINKGANDILSRTAGAIINPNMQLLFSGPQLRPFDFSYKLSPRDRGESIQVQKIIRMFKQSSAVQRTATEFFLRSPNRYKLQFLTRGDSAHTFLPKIKTCALLGFGVNYTPDNSFMTYENSSMVSYNITFSFQEIEPVFNDEYGNEDGDIGF